jgi:predicted PurR-regulated permease PerM
MAEQRQDYMRIVVALAATIWLLIAVRSVVQPLIVSIMIWFILSATAGFYTRIFLGPGRPPTRLAKAASALTFVVAFVLFSAITVENAEQVKANLPIYEANLDQMIATLGARIGLEETFAIGDLMARIDISQIALGVVGSAASSLSSLIIVAFYVLFIFFEAKRFPTKLAAISRDAEQRAQIAELVARIHKEVETYLGVKCVLGLIQGTITFAVLELVGVDSAGFWAVVIFVFSFVPTIGTLVGIIFPSLIALLQFEEITPFLIVITALIPAQILCSNLLEPRMMGSSLNLSPLAVFIAIFAGGALWGIVGALICVPALSIAVIAFSQTQTLWPVAVLLSNDGRIDVAARPSANRPKHVEQGGREDGEEAFQAAQD